MEGINFFITFGQMKKQILFTLMLLLSTITVLLGQETNSDFIRVYPDKVYLSPYYLYKYPVIQLKPEGRTNDWMAKYYPNTANSFGVQFRYKTISFGVGLSNTISQTKIDRFGESKAIDVNVKVAQPSRIIEVYVKRYQGLTDLNAPNYPQDSIYNYQYYNRPDATFWYSKVNYIHIFNKQEYSYRATFNFMERQVKSAGSLLLIANATYNCLRGDTALLASPIRSAYQQMGTLEAFATLDSGIGAGYGYTKVFGDFFISGAGFLGIDYQNNRILNSDSLDKWETKASAVPLLDIRTTIGFNNDRIFAGLVYNADFNFINFNNVNGFFNYNLLIARIGIRFAAPKLLKRIENKNPLKKQS